MTWHIDLIFLSKIKRKLKTFLQILFRQLFSRSKYINIHSFFWPVNKPRSTFILFELSLFTSTRLSSTLRTLLLEVFNWLLVILHRQIMRKMRTFWFFTNFGWYQFCACPWGMGVGGSIDWKQLSDVRDLYTRNICYYRFVPWISFGLGFLLP